VRPCGYFRAAYIDAAAVTPTIAAYFNLTHPDKAVRILGPDESEANLNWNVAVGASAKGTLDCVSAWVSDFRNDLPRINLPTLVIHGDSDRILPIAATGIRTHKAVKGARLVVVEGGPHGLTWTHAEKVNCELLAFLGERKSIGAEA